MVNLSEKQSANKKKTKQGQSQPIRLRDSTQLIETIESPIKSFESATKMNFLKHAEFP